MTVGFFFGKQTKAVCKEMAHVRLPSLHLQGSVRTCTRAVTSCPEERMSWLLVQTDAVQPLFTSAWAEGKDERVRWVLLGGTS